MSADHNRPVPVPPERLDYFARTYGSGQPDSFAALDKGEQRTILQLALQAELVETQQATAFYLQEAYTIYNARFR